MSAEPGSEWTTRRAVELAVGDDIAGDMLPLGIPGEVIFVRQHERHRSCWTFVAFVQRDGFHDSTTFLADAKVRVRIVEPQQVAEPQPLTPAPIASHYDASAFTAEHVCACGSEFDSLSELKQHISAANADPTGLAYTRADDADDPTPVSPARVPMHTGGMTDEGLVDETPAEPVTRYFSFGHGQIDPWTDESLLDHYVTVTAPTAEACREAMLASRFGREWAFEYTPGTPQADEWIPRWTEYERINAMPKAES